MKRFLLVLAAAGSIMAYPLPAQQGGRHFQLTTQFLEQQKLCLEGNSPGGDRGGAAFMMTCGTVGGQLWRAVPTGRPGYFKLQVSYMNRCLEGNDPSSQVAGGGAFMDECQPVTGQEWRLVPLPSGYYQLRSESGQRCLEGNSPGGSLGGVAFLDRCANVSGQAWRLHGARIVNGLPIGAL